MSATIPEAFGARFARKRGAPAGRASVSTASRPSHREGSGKPQTTNPKPLAKPAQPA